MILRHTGHIGPDEGLNLRHFQLGGNEQDRFAALGFDPALFIGIVILGNSKAAGI